MEIKSTRIACRLIFESICHSSSILTKEAQKGVKVWKLVLRSFVGFMVDKKVVINHLPIQSWIMISRRLNYF